MSKGLIDQASVRKRGIKELIGGIIAAAVGALVSWGSYSTAKPGQTYTVYTGIIALGVGYAIVGVIDIAFPQLRLKNSKGKKANNIANESETAKEEVVVEED